jgi:hypothetical protein
MHFAQVTSRQIDDHQRAQRSCMQSNPLSAQARLKYGGTIEMRHSNGMHRRRHVTRSCLHPCQSVNLLYREMTLLEYSVYWCGEELMSQ